MKTTKQLVLIRNIKYGFESYMETEKLRHLDHNEYMVISEPVTVEFTLLDDAAVRDDAIKRLEARRKHLCNETYEALADIEKQLTELSRRSEQECER